MPVDYRFNPQHQLVVCEANGYLTVDELAAYTRRLSSDPDFNPQHNQLFCFLQVDATGLSSMDMRRMAQTSIFAPGTRRVFVTPPGLVFGLGRSFASYIEENDEQVELVQSRAAGAEAFGLAVEDLDWPD